METNWFHYISYINFPTSYRNLVLSSTPSVHKRGTWGSVKVSQQATRTVPLQKGIKCQDVRGRTQTEPDLEGSQVYQWLLPS